MSAHTPGPWKVVKTGHTVPYRVETENRCMVANAVAGGGTSDDGEANARLIAAAPELLAALVLARSALELASTPLAEDRQAVLVLARSALELASTPLAEDRQAVLAAQRAVSAAIAKVEGRS